MPSVVLRGLMFGLAMLASTAASAQLYDFVSGDDFELPANVPPSDAEAARFLNTATFGATAQDIAAVRSIGISQWITQQFALAPTLSRPWLEAYAASLPAGEGLQGQTERLNRWNDVAVTAPDQLRQRVAFALSQIIVTSDQSDRLFNEPIMMAEWNDLLVRNALGNYRQLLGEATLSPVMGNYLSMIQNRKYELEPVGTPGGAGFYYQAGNGGAQPDENYAREVMQLFSLGLLVRESDFYTLSDNPNLPGTQPWDSYDAGDIRALARIFTGFGHDCTQGNAVVGGVPIMRNCGANNTACTGIGCRFRDAGDLFSQLPPGDVVPQGRGLVHPDAYRPMVCYPRFNDNGRDQDGNVLPNPAAPPTLAQPLPPGSPGPNKVLSISGTTVLTILPSTLNNAPLDCNQTGNPPLSTAQMQACVNYCEGAVQSALDVLFNHPSTPPMVARQLIQRLVTSNPSAAYVQRVAQAFVNNGAAVRGDMKAVVRAILTDFEARRPARLAPTNFGKSREPMLKLIALWRHFGAVSSDTALLPATNPQGGNANPLAGQPGLRHWTDTYFDPLNWFMQRPLGAPTVFNFYQPDYRQPGPLAQAGLYSPEFQILSEVSTVDTANSLYDLLCRGYDACRNGETVGPPGSTTAPVETAYFPSAALDLIPSVMNASIGQQPTVGQDTALIEFFNTRVFGGTMTGTLPTTVSCPNGTGSGTKGLLMDALRCPGGINSIDYGTQQERQRMKSLLLMHLIALLPEFNTQR